MPYQSKDLSVLAYANGFTLWHYATADAHTAVRVAGYFNAASHMLRIGDMILANTGIGGAPVSGILLVSHSLHSEVQVTNMCGESAK